MVRFTCPRCKAVLEHGAEGATVECPTCGQSLEVPVLQTVLALDDPGVPDVRRSNGAPRRSGHRRDDRYCPDCGAPVERADRYCPECDLELPRRRRLEPHRGSLVMVLGILSLVVAPIVLGPIAWILGNEDLKKMRAGKMDPEGESPTNTGRVCGMIATILGIVMLVVGIIIAIVFFSFVATVATQHPPPRMR
jgi:hypothetical protein